MVVRHLQHLHSDHCLLLLRLEDDEKKSWEEGRFSFKLPGSCITHSFSLLKRLETQYGSRVNFGGSGREGGHLE